MKALFLDRDGIINVDHGYVSTIEEFEFNEGIFELLRLFVQDGYTLFVLTNQSGIGRGYYDTSDFQKLTTWMLQQLKTEEIPVESVHYCHHTPEEMCHCRKPSIGMIEPILYEYDIDLGRSWMIGDKQSDIDFAQNSGIAHTIAIGPHPIINSDYHFETILEAKTYFEANWDKIAL